jgi:hypothetical protein
MSKCSSINSELDSQDQLNVSENRAPERQAAPHSRISEKDNEWRARSLGSKISKWLHRRSSALLPVPRGSVGKIGETSVYTRKATLLVLYILAFLV